MLILVDNVDYDEELIAIKYEMLQLLKTAERFGKNNFPLSTVNTN